MYEGFRSGRMYIRLVQDMYESSMTVVRCSVGVTEVGQHQGPTMSPCLFAVVMDRRTDAVMKNVR